MPLVILLLATVVIAAIRSALGTPLLHAFTSSTAFVLVGLGGLFFALGHLARGPWVAQRIGWPANNPFQAEVAAANLALGVLGVASAFFARDFSLAAALGYAVFYWGCALTHVCDRRRSGNLSPANSGAHVWLSVLLPILLLGGLLVERR